MDKKKIYKYPVSWEYQYIGKLDGMIMNQRVEAELFCDGVQKTLYVNNNHIGGFLTTPNDIVEFIKLLDVDKNIRDFVKGKMIHVQKINDCWKDVTPVEV